MLLHPNAPLLPAWATDEQVTEAVETILDDWADYDRNLNHQVKTQTPQLIAEAEALLKHEAEGWL